MSPRNSLFAVVFVVGHAGCGGPDAANSVQKETEAIAGLIADVPDKTSSPVPAKQLFVTPPPKSELKQFAASTFEMLGKASVSGDTATARVKVTDADGREGEVEWTFIRDGEQWKVKDAPLP